jgi:hypothetical protein
MKTAQALSYRDASQELQDCFVRYFSEGMTPSAALKYHKDCLEMAEDFTEDVLADASKNPLAFTVYRWHDSWRKSNLGELYCVKVQYLRLVRSNSGLLYNNIKSSELVETKALTAAR